MASSPLKKIITHYNLYIILYAETKDNLFFKNTRKKLPVMPNPTAWFFLVKKHEFFQTQSFHGFTNGLESGMIFRTKFVIL
jgi:hypothetical protein